MRARLLALPAAIAAAGVVLSSSPPRATSAEAGSAAPDDATHVFVGATLLPMTGAGALEDAVLAVRGGTIVAVGRRSEVDVEALSTGDGRGEVVFHDVAGKTLLPGLICTHSHIGGPAGADSSEPIQPETRVIDSINVRSASLDRARAGGITTVNVMPGSGHLSSGQTVYLKLRDGGSVEDLALYEEDGDLAGGLKMANGTNPQGEPPFPGTRGKAAALVRAAFVEAQGYAAKVAAAGDDPGALPPRNLRLEVLAEVLAGERVVHHHTHRHDDILTVLRLSEEFGFRVVLHHVSDAWKVADEIAAAGAPCSIIMIDSPGGKLEARDVRWENGAALERAGALVGFHTDDWITDSRLFLRSGALAVRAGMSRQKALEGLTIAGARMLDLDERIGSLEVGKDADFVVLSGDPLSVYTDIEETWIEGVRVFDLDDPEDRLVATGGYGANDESPNEAQLCCALLGGGRQ